MTRLLFAAALALLPALSHAQTDPLDILRDRGLAAAVEAANDSPDFLRGTLMTLRAVERSLQAAASHGLGKGLTLMPGFPWAAQRGLPRGTTLPQPDTPGTIIRDLLADLEVARKLLNDDPAPEPFVLALGDVWLDTNADGIRDPREGAVETLLPILTGQRRPAPPQAVPPAIRFDAADRDWLVAYTHMVSGAGSLFLAFDPTPVLRDLAAQAARLEGLPVVPEYYDLDALRARLPGLESQVKDARDRMRALAEAMRPYRERQRVLSNRLRANPTPAEKLEIEAAQAALNQDRAPLMDEDQRLSRERRSAAEELQSIQRILGQPAIGDRTPGDDFGSMARDPLTLLYVVLTALRQQPDIGHAQSARDHWLAMIAANRRFWAAVEAETDNDREWIPNSRQQSALPVEVDPEAGPAWLRVLDDAEALLTGRLLIAHPMLPDGTGISLSTWFEAPGPIDLLAWIQGVGAYPYAARGPRISGLSWRRFTAMTQGRTAGVALWFN